VTEATLRIGRFGLTQAALARAAGALALAAISATPAVHAPAALLFLLAGLALFVLTPRASATALLAHPVVLLLPAFCILSTIWSVYPGTTLRHAVQLAATVAIALAAARATPFRDAMLAAFAVLAAVVAVSIAAGPYRSDTGALVGLFGSKNEMGGMSALTALLGFGLAASVPLPWLLRLLGAAGFAVGLTGAVLAQSLGALGYIPIGIGALVAVLLLRRLRLPAALVAAVFCALALVLAGIAVAANADRLASAFFEATGKDMTLTGRVELWEVAVNLIAERPLLGSGYQAFWVQGNPAAEALWAHFDIASRSGFNFHNVYFSNAVEIGLAGIAIEAGLIGAAVVLSARLALRSGDPGAALLFGFAVMTTAVTLFEAPIFFQFNLQTVLMVMVLAYAKEGLRRISVARSPRAG
jgi:exopolysaccharide production protein ExoQ